MTTKADRARFDAFRKIGCIACRQNGVFQLADVHHLLVGGRRKGHQFTIPLCPWHHRGAQWDGHTVKMMETANGPSLARAPRKFREEFGSDASLLHLTNKLVELLK